MLEKNGRGGQARVRHHGEVRTPPFSPEARVQAGCLLRGLQRGDLLGLPHSQPMQTIGPRCHELRVRDRVVYRIDPDAIVIVEVFAKESQKTPRHVIAACRRRLNDYDQV
jgi:phage-related protein